jgi:hypothetical protein
LKKSDVAWVEMLARHACGRSARSQNAHEQMLHAVQDFCDELCHTLNSYSVRFNELVQSVRADSVVRVFRLGNNRAGLMLLRGRDKLMIIAEPPRIRARIVQVQAYGEKSVETLDFEAQLDGSQEISWVSVIDGQRVNPELVARYYLSPFLASGCEAYVPQQIPTEKVVRQ